jgi:DNA-binding beta-propeller fold protein YncE
VDPATGDIYVADSRRGDVVVVDSLGGFIRNLQVPGGRAGDVVVRGDSVWVSDVNLGKISVYEKQSGAEARAIPEYGRSTDLGLAQPLNFDVTDDAVIVSDFGGFRVQVYSHSGEHIRTIGSQGRGYGQFISNKGVAVDRGGAIYVVDAAFNNVQIFNREGQLLTFLDGLVLPAGVAISYDPVLVDAFSEHAMEGRTIEYLIFVVSQYGPNQLTVYGFLEAAGEAVGS